jgi:6-pyruvoyltetrahydropterin/6-carboxytetrahydropterin synthase
MLFDFSERIQRQLPQNVLLHSLKLYETANSYAEWFADDQIQ